MPAGPEASEAMARRFMTDGGHVAANTPSATTVVVSSDEAAAESGLDIRPSEQCVGTADWLIDLTDRTVAIHRMADGYYARAVLLQLRGQTAITAVPGVSIDWDRLLAVLGQSR
jgi:hypothetical protein